MTPASAFDQTWLEFLKGGGGGDEPDFPEGAEVLPRAELEKLVSLDMWHRWALHSDYDFTRPKVNIVQLGDIPKLEWYHAHFQQLWEAGKPSLELISSECRARLHAGDRAMTQDYLQRFPDLDPHKLATAIAHVEDEAATWTAASASAGAQLWPQEIAERLLRCGYALVRKLGTGGMGVVFQARSIPLQRDVALKLVPASDSRCADLHRRLRREAEITARLNHASIIQIHHLIEDEDGLLGLVLELAEGGSIDTLVRTDGCSAKRGAQLVRDLALALHYAHERHIVHCDMKPENVFLTKSGQVKLGDFGLAKVIDVSKIRENVGEFGGGTVPYMAPEQTRQESEDDIGPATDVYGAGIIFYELLTGKPPFAGSIDELLLKIRTEDPVPPSKVRESVPKALEAICLRALAKKPRDRYPTALDLARDLDRYLTPQRIGPRLDAMATVVAFTIGLLFVDAMSPKRPSEGSGSEQHSREVANRDVGRAKSALEAEDLAGARAALQRVPPGMRRLEWGLLQRRTEGSIYTLLGQLHLITSLAFSPDGSKLVTGSDDGTAWIWDAREGACVHKLADCDAAVMGVAFSHNGQLVVTCGGHHVRIFSTNSGEMLKDVRHAEEVTCIAFSTEGARFATGSATGMLRLWDLHEGRLFAEWNAGEGRPVSCVAFSPDGSELATASGDKVARIWVVETQQHRTQLIGHTEVVSGIAFSPDGTKVATCSHDSTSRVFDASTGSLLIVLNGHRDKLWGIAISPDGRRIATAGDDATVRIWDARNGASLLVLRGHSRWVRAVSFSPDGAFIASGSDDCTVKLWDVREGEPRTRLLCHADLVRSVAISPDETQAVTGCWDGKVRVFDLRRGELIRTLEGHDGKVTGVAWNPDGTLIASAGGDKSVRVWDARSSKQLHLFPHSDRVTAIAFSPSGSSVASACEDGVVRIRSIDGSGMSRISPRFNKVWSVAFHPSNDNLLAFGAADGIVRWWDLLGDRLLGQTEIDGDVWALSFSSRGDRLAAASGNGTCVLIDVAKRLAIRKFVGHQKGVTGVAYCPDSERIVTSSSDRTLRIWDVETGEELLTFGRDRAEYWAVAVAARTGSFLVVVGKGLPGEVAGFAKVCRTRSALDRVTITPGCAITGVGLSPEGTEVIIDCGSEERTIWNTKTGERMTDFLVKNAKGMRVYENTDRVFVLNGNAVEVLRPVLPDNMERSYRRWATSAGYEWHWYESVAARNTRDEFALAFHLKHRRQLRPDLEHLFVREEAAFQQTIAKPRP